MLEGSITESGSQFPLCDNCYSAYEGRRARLNKFMVVSFVLGLIGFVSLFPLGIEEHGYNSPVIVVMCLVNSVLIIASSIFLKMKGRAFPIRFESKLVGLMSTKRVSVFNCPNVEVYDRFMRAEMVDDD